MTCGFLIQLLFCQKKTMWFIGVEVEQETSAPPPKKNPGSAPERFLLLAIKIITRRYYSSRSLWRWGLHFNDRLTKKLLGDSIIYIYYNYWLLDIKNIINYQVEKVQRKKGTMLAGQQWHQLQQRCQEISETGGKNSHRMIQQDINTHARTPVTRTRITWTPG